MKSLTKDQISQKTKIADELEMVAECIRDSIAAANSEMEELIGPIEVLRARYNELQGEAQALMQSVHERIEAYMEERSESWVNSERGQSYQAWEMDWDILLEDIEICFPEPIEDPEMDALVVLGGLLDQP